MTMTSAAPGGTTPIQASPATSPRRSVYTVRGNNFAAVETGTFDPKTAH